MGLPIEGAKLATEPTPSAWSSNRWLGFVAARGPLVWATLLQEGRANRSVRERELEERGRQMRSQVEGKLKRGERAIRISGAATGRASERAASRSH